jgi:hypothetical protein
VSFTYLYLINNLILKAMKRSEVTMILISGTLILGLIFLSMPGKSQELAKTATGLPEDVNKIVTASCTPCHTSQGGLMSKGKLNLTEWNKYSPAKQKEKAAKMYSEVNKGAMPPKNAREKKPELIPTKEQTEIIKKWSESFPAEVK